MNYDYLEQAKGFANPNQEQPDRWVHLGILHALIAIAEQLEKMNEEARREILDNSITRRGTP